MHLVCCRRRDTACVEQILKNCSTNCIINYGQSVPQSCKTLHILSVESNGRQSPSLDHAKKNICKVILETFWKTSIQNFCLLNQSFSNLSSKHHCGCRPYIQPSQSHTWCSESVYLDFQSAVKCASHLQYEILQPHRPVH